MRSPVSGDLFAFLVADGTAARFPFSSIWSSPWLGVTTMASMRGLYLAGARRSAGPVPPREKPCCLELAWHAQMGHDFGHIGQLRRSVDRPERDSADALFTGTQQRVPGVLFGQPRRSFYASELTRTAGTGSGAAQR